MQHFSNLARRCLTSKSAVPFNVNPHTPCRALVSAAPAQDPSATNPPTRVRKQRKPAALEVTPAAEQRIVNLLSQRQPRPAGVRIGLRTRGCNGMAYVLNYADHANQFDEKVEINGGVVYIDPRALMHIIGTKMDFVDNDLVSEFIFHNPNAKGTCGCGESFNV